VVLAGDGGFMLNLGELACAAQEKANLLVLLMNDAQYGVIRNIQDDVYGGRHAFVDLHTPDFAQLCASMGVAHARIASADQCATVLAQVWQTPGPVVVEVDMRRFGAFAAKFAGPILKKD
jgi:acetolactate synthase I/II/III large subunit